MAVCSGSRSDAARRHAIRKKQGDRLMLTTTSIRTLALAAAALAIAVGGARAGDEMKYPDLRGEWHGTGGNKWPTPAPLTAEFQAIFEANLRDQEAGGPGDTPTIGWLPPGMPREVDVFYPLP